MSFFSLRYFEIMLKFPEVVEVFSHIETPSPTMNWERWEIFKAKEKEKEDKQIAKEFRKECEAWRDEFIGQVDEDGNVVAVSEDEPCYQFLYMTTTAAVLVTDKVWTQQELEMLPNEERLKVEKEIAEKEAKRKAEEAAALIEETGMKLQDYRKVGIW